MDGSRRWWWPAMALLALGLVAGTVTAHVEYVASEGDPVGPLDLWGAVASDPLGLTLIATTVVAAAAAGFAWRRWGERIPDVDVLREVLDGYEDLVPWMIRLSVGVPLVGAGFSGYLLTPALPVELRLLQVLVGFLLLLGLTTRGAALLGLVGWLSVFGVYGPTLFLAGEYTGAFIALILVGPGRPSLDHMLEQVAEDEGTWYHRVDPIHEAGERFRAFVAPARPWAPVAVRLTLGATLAYLGIWEKILDPGPAIALARDLGLPGSISAEAWVVGAGLVELGVGLLLVAGLFTRAASAAAFLVLTVTLFALPNDPVLAHVSLFGLASVVFTWGAGPLSLDRSPPTGDR